MNLEIIKQNEPKYPKRPKGRAAKRAICLIHQANFLLDQQLRALEKDFLEQGGFTEKLYQKRNENEKNNQKTEKTKNPFSYGFFDRI